MLDFHAAGDRAVRYAVKTGHMPNVHLVHTRQQSEGYEPCFGRPVERCSRAQCRWFHECMALCDFDPASCSHAEIVCEAVAVQREAGSLHCREPPMRTAATATSE